MKVDNHDFNHDHYKGWTEENFIKDQFASIPDSYGSDENKVAFLKEAHKQINPIPVKAVKADKEAK